MEIDGVPEAQGGTEVPQTQIDEEEDDDMRRGRRSRSPVRPHAVSSTSPPIDPSEAQRAG